ncbi:ATP-binding protein [Shewanella sp. Isolate11]|uniref:ATP-binding protein n=1 Tax=Shewanella sp. Isolate11 TaxID=2908530 RepID=UPI001EFD537D|nr:ATP-binding protein [Shewanella sp. Isolate11]MCG9697644.1 ATP-binding protein [Shewanella sp. Isolate11]
MKFQFYRLYALLIISSALIIWSFSEIHDSYQQETESYQLDVETVFENQLQNPQSLLSYLSTEELALPKDLTDRLAQGKTIALTLSNNQTYYYRQAPEPGHFLALGPITHKVENRVPPELIIFALYASLGCLALLLIWPLFKDLATLQQDAISFGAKPRKMPQRIKKSSAIYPLAKVYNQISGEVVDLIQMHKELSRTVSHEVRTPLSRMRFALQLSKEELSTKYWQRLNADIDEIEQLANTYLSFAKLEHREAKITKNLCSAEEFMAQLEEKFCLYQHKISIDFSYHGDKAYLDNNSMCIAAQNLIMNALRFAQSRIIVTMECSEQLCKLTVQDDGPGFEGKGKQLLAAFVRDKEQSDSSGYGLGLYIVRKVAIWHQGALQIDNGDQLKGACLSIEWKNQPTTDIED